MNPSNRTTLISTGVEQLDAILNGGLPQGELYLVQGTPGTGKTLLGVQFLRAGIDEGERCLFVSLSQEADDLRHNVEGAGLSLEDIEVDVHLPVEDPGSFADEQVIFHAENVELGETVRALLQAVERTEPDRVVFDGIGYVRLLSRSSAHYRRQLLSLRRFFSARDVTVLFTDDQSVAPGDGELKSLVYGVLCLDQELSDYGDERRSLRVLKLRGTDYTSGRHDFVIEEGGLRVFPRPRTDEASKATHSRVVTSGVDGVDALLGGGLEEGTSCLIVGPSGTGKSSLATLYVDAAAQRGEAAAVFLFDELERTFIRRSETLGMEVSRHVEEGRLSIHSIATGQLSPGAFAHFVRREVQERDVRVVVIDTLTGYLSAMPDERFLVTQMHDLLASLSKQGVLTILVVAQHGVVGRQLHAPVDVSYLADAVVLTRHFEADGALHQAVSVFKKRYGSHERRIRELFIREGGLELGEPMEEATGILQGHPVTNSPVVASAQQGSA